MEEVQTYFANKQDMSELQDINNFLETRNESDYPDIVKIKNNLLKNITSREKQDTQIPMNKSQQELNSLFDKIDKKVQMQDWRKLPKYIQNDKIKEYVEMKIEKSKQSDTYKQILEGIKNHKIKRTHIKYNKELCQIDEIKIK